jgi:prepilin-type processing-associated H-X9-DG protein
MKPRTSSPERGDSGLLDLFVMLIAVGAVVLVGFAYIQTRHTGGKAQRINCVNNLRQVGLSYRLWGSDNGEKYPAQVSTNAGGTMELVASGLVFPTFAVMSNELGTPKIIACPEDTKRTCGTNFGTLRDAEVSYFTVPEADESNAELWLSGDRNLATNSVALKPGLFVMPTNRMMSWTVQIHQHKGNMALADGSVGQYSSTTLQQSVTNVMRIWLATTNAPFRLAIP